jgi:hypothetical protein
MLNRWPSDCPKGAGGFLRHDPLRLGPPNALYVAFEVNEDVFVQNQTGPMTWKGDCVQMDFNLAPEKELILTGNHLADAAAGKPVSEIDLALTHNGPNHTWSPQLTAGVSAPTLGDSSVVTNWNARTLLTCSGTWIRFWNREP